jgi:hypothetical protein
MIVDRAGGFSPAPTAVMRSPCTSTVIPLEMPARFMGTIDTFVKAVMAGGWFPDSPSTQAAAHMAPNVFMRPILQ